jgi:hypothetical protein
MKCNCKELCYQVMFQFLTAKCMKMVAFLVVAPSSLVEVSDVPKVLAAFIITAQQPRRQPFATLLLVLTNSGRFQGWMSL